MHKLGLVTHLWAAMMAMTVLFTGFLFVDDTNLIALSMSNQHTAMQVMVHIQHAICVWHGGL
jgi:hypothetical protein